MPNPGNIARPITLISYGRSGTSLAFNILAAHEDVDGCGETMPLLFGTWEGAQRLKGVVRSDGEPGPETDHRARCGKAVRAAFLSFFESPAPDWVHKPINVPWTIPNPVRNDPARFEQAAADYWQTMAFSFPQSRNLTILRHPYDVVLSARAYWKYPLDHIWRSIVNMAQIVNHADSDISFAISHQRLVTEPEVEIRRLLAHVGLSEDPACFAAAEKVYVPKKGAGRRPKAKMADHVARAFSHRERWDSIDMSGFTDADREIIAAMWARFGEELTF